MSEKPTLSTVICHREHEAACRLIEEQRKKIEELEAHAATDARRFAGTEQTIDGNDIVLTGYRKLEVRVTRVHGESIEACIHRADSAFTELEKKLNTRSGA